MMCICCEEVEVKKDSDQCEFCDILFGKLDDDDKLGIVIEMGCEGEYHG